MKKIDIVFLFLALSLIFTGCSPQINESTNNTKTSEINNNTSNISTQPTKTITPKSYTMKDIETYFAMNRQEIIKLLGINYSEGTLIIEKCHIPLNALMFQDGFAFFGLSKNDSFPTRIECSEDVEIDGLKNGMDFSQIEKILGKKNIQKTWIGNEEILAYEISYFIGNICLQAVSYDKDGSGSYLVFSQVDSESSQDKDVGNKYDKKIGVFHLGMKFEDLMKLDLYNTDYQITETTQVTDDVNAWDYGNNVIWTPLTCCFFDKENTLYRITVNGDIPTSFGIKIGDSVEKVKTLFGKCDKQYKYDWGKVLEYNMGDYFVFVSVQQNQISLWGISEYKYDYNGPKQISNTAANSFFFNDHKIEFIYKGNFLFDDTITENAKLYVSEIAELKDGKLYHLKIESITGVPDNRLDLGFFYVKQDEATKDALGKDNKGWHQYIAANGNKREYHSYNNLVETGFYESFVWEKNRGLIKYRSGFGAERDSIDLELTNN